MDEPIQADDAPEQDAPEQEDPFAVPDDPFAEDEEIVASQEQIGKTLDRARAGDDRALGMAVREDGEVFVRIMFGLLRMIRLHDLDNAAFDKPTKECADVLSRLIELLGSIIMVTVEDQVYLNDIRIRFDARAEAARGLGREMRRHRVGGITFHSAPSVEHIKLLVDAFAGEPDEDLPRTALQTTLNENNADHIELFGVFRFRVTGEEEFDPDAQMEQTEEHMAEVVDRGSDLVLDSLDGMSADRMPNPLPMRRLVTEIVEGGIGAEGLWDEAGVGDAYASHVVRVCRLSLLLGRSLGLSDEALQDLGVCALFHDIGYAAREGSVKGGPDQEAIVGFAPPFERHAAAGGRLLLRQRGFHMAKIMRVLTTIEHHSDYDPGDDNPVLFARILRIVEDFDNYIRGRGGGFTAAEALGRMVPWAGTRYDPILIQLFVNMMGKYPPGSMLLLDDGRIAVSVGTARSKETFDKPVVRVVRDIDGREYEEDEYLDLAKGGGVRLALNSRPEGLRRIGS